MKWLAALIVFLPAFVSAAPADPAPAPPVDIAALRQMCGDASSSKLVFRDEKGAPTDEKTVLAAVNSGSSVSCKPENGSGVAVFTLDPKVAGPGKTVSSMVVGSHLPAFALTSSQGRKVSSERFDHDITVVDFFFYDCGGCIAEMPALNAFHAAHPEVGALSITYDSVAQLPAFQKKFGLTWEIVPDAVAFYEKANIQAFPTLGIVDREGRLLDIKGGWTIHPPGRALTGEDIAHWVADVRSRAGRFP